MRDLAQSAELRAQPSLCPKALPTLVPTPWDVAVMWCSELWGLYFKTLSLGEFHTPPGQEIPEAPGQLPPLLTPLTDCPLLIPVREMTKADNDNLPSPASLCPPMMEGCPSSSAEVSHMIPDFFLFLMWFLSLVLSSEHRKSFCLPCAMKDMFQETPPGPTLALHPWWGGACWQFRYCTGSR